MIREIDASYLGDLRQFLNNAGNSTDSFRYFKNRPLSIIENHLITLLYYDNSKPVGYGHLDKENGTVWLGICIAENSQGKGIGKSIMNELMRQAELMEVKSIHLSVDNNNQYAQSLYKAYNFAVLKKTPTTIFMIKNNEYLH